MRNIRTQRFGNTERKTFSRIKEVLDLPNLIEVQKNSYDAFVCEGIRIGVVDAGFGGLRDDRFTRDRKSVV